MVCSIDNDPCHPGEILFKQALFFIVDSAQLMIMGVFGEYFGRIYMAAKQWPLCIALKCCTMPAAWTEIGMTTGAHQRTIP